MILIWLTKFGWVLDRIWIKFPFVDTLWTRYLFNKSLWRILAIMRRQTGFLI
jgi:hypothetical protein